MLGLVYIFLNDAKNDTYLLELLQCYVKMSIEEINLVVLLSSWDTMSVSLTRNKFSIHTSLSLSSLMQGCKDVQKVSRKESNAPDFHQAVLDL